MTKDFYRYQVDTAPSEVDPETVAALELAAQLWRKAIPAVMGATGANAVITMAVINGHVATSVWGVFDQATTDITVGFLRDMADKVESGEVLLPQPKTN
jgi:hypothetical protein